MKIAFPEIYGYTQSLMVSSRTPFLPIYENLNILFSKGGNFLFMLLFIGDKNTRFIAATASKVIAV